MAFLVVAHVENTLLQHVTESEYDLSNRPSRVKTHKVTKDYAGNITSEHIYTGEVAFDDAFGRLTEFDEKVGATHTAYTTTFGYDEENRPTSVEYGSYGESTIEYDGLGRVAKTTVKAGSGAEASTAYTYVAGAALETEAPEDADDERKEAAANAAGKTSTTGLVQKIEQTGGSFEYTYDDNGNITSVKQDGVKTVYTYDALGQLTQVDDSQENATWKYEYDQGGNIKLKSKFGLNSTSSNADEIVEFKYDNANWRDQLTSTITKVKQANGTYSSTTATIEYDQIGNPTDDGTWQYEWVNGRQLARIYSIDTDASFVYNENGLRVQKTVNGVVTKYTLYGKNIVHMTQGSNELHFFYDSKGKPAVVVYNDTPYSYVKNLQGDIVAILNSAGAVVVSYKYDAWGRPISKTGTLASTLGTVQPFRYRGYVYDEETGLYYLRSRYYSSEWLRFVNADMLLQPNFNLFTYCTQNPTNRIDPDGASEVCQINWEMMSNRSLLSPYNLSMIAGDCLGDTSGINDSYSSWKATQEYDARWVNSGYNNTLINATSDPNNPGLPQYQPNEKGLYGTEGKNVRVISGTAEDAIAFFEAMTYGQYVYQTTISYNGINRYMRPYGNVTFRPNSKSGSPVVEFNNYPSVKNQKVHFEVMP